MDHFRRLTVNKLKSRRQAWAAGGERRGKWPENFCRRRFIDHGERKRRRVNDKRSEVTEDALAESWNEFARLQLGWWGGERGEEGGPRAEAR